ncbi:DsbA family protein [Acetobacteraceae bacterium H6797]|nr:DsbA family protein [Acetobacteraceae bacterium H6797]
MPMNRRHLMLGAGSVALAGTGLITPAMAQAADPRMADRAVGKADAKVTVIEYFSLTCPHCAAFHRTTYPQVKKELIDTGKIRFVFRDFPLDQLALAGAMVARALPADRYEGFVGVLLGSQDRWAFNRNVNNMEEIAKLAALAGMSRPDFEKTIGDDGLRRAILEGRLKAEQTDKVDATPTFLFNGNKQSGELSYDRFAELVAKAGG